ncbi:MAG: amidohydrolase family protein [Candidatus Sumerlaeaceae bacterium]|nr:amidohydrolase family protein [Candidatus Sumerlaeaceae bacterium]
MSGGQPKSAADPAQHSGRSPQAKVGDSIGEAETPYELVFANVVICDGTGAPARLGHVAVLADKIALTTPAHQPAPPARRIIDGRGELVLAPGFIDVHSHSDYTAIVLPLSESKIAQGITTEIVGNCGFSAFPLRGELLDDEKIAQRHLALHWTWATAEEYFALVEQTKPAVNVASFVGHRNVRAAAMGFADRRPSHEELRAMKQEIEHSMEAGALGLSTGLIYVPGMFAPTDELIELAKVVSRYGGIYASHVRGEGDRLLSAVDEFFQIVNSANVAAQYSHLKASGRRNWGKIHYVVERIDQSVAQSTRLAFDRYPYTASSTELSSLLPRWVLAGGREAALKRLSRPEIRRQIRSELEDDFAGEEPWSDILLANIIDNEFARFRGWRLSAIAHELRMDEFDLFFELLRASQLEIWICHFTMSEGDMVTVLTHPLCMVCTDAESYSFSSLAGTVPHPRGFGAFPRFLQYFVRERGLLSLEEAIRKITSLPAQMFGLRDRGVIRPGYAADLVLFNPSRIEDPSVFGETPRQPKGIELVVVNGTITYEHGHFLSKGAGRVLRRENR